MGILDPLFRALADGIDLFKRLGLRDRRTDVFSGREEVTEEELEEFKQADPEEQLQFIQEKGGVDGPIQELLEFVVGGTFTTLEDAIDDELTEGNLANLDKAEENINDAEGVALSEALTLIAGQTVIETVSAGQVDSFETPIAEILSFLALDDVVGTRIGVTMEQAVLPSLEAEIAKQNRTQFVSLQDAVELALRNKEADEGFLTPENAPPRVQSLIGSDDPVNPDNLVEEWGIRDDNLPILEEVALEAMEFEELIETPAELGKIVDDDVLDLVLDINGYPEELKEFLREIPEEIPRSNRVWEERTAVEPVVAQLETLAADEEVSPTEAVDIIPDLDDRVQDALRDRFGNLQDVPAGPPTRSLIEDSALLGLTDIRTLEARLERLEYDTDDYSDVVDTTILKEIDGDLQQAMALGFISEATYGELMDRVGLDDETQQALMAGQDLGTVADRRLQEQATPAEQSVASIVGIGEARAAALAGIGVESVGDLAQADPETVAEAAQVSPETAQEFIAQARQRVS